MYICVVDAPLEHAPDRVQTEDHSLVGQFHPPYALAYSTDLALSYHSRVSTKRPAMAAAAAISGLTRWVRPPFPCRPSKLRLEVDAQR